VLVDEVQHHRGLDPETGGRNESVAQPLVQEADALARTKRRDFRGKLRRIEIRIRVEFDG
jgi:hypothetical protein